MVEVFFQGYGYWDEIHFSGKQGYYNPTKITDLRKYERHIGVFCLSKNDEMAFKHSGSLDCIINCVSTLLPSLTHPDSNFLKNGLNNPDDCYFKIRTGEEMILVLAKDQGNIKVDIEPLCNMLYQSDQLRILNEASQRWWGNADPNEKDTHTKNEIVITWLIKKGFSKVSAKQGATIIRPEWAAKGNY